MPKGIKPKVVEIMHTTHLKYAYMQGSRLIKKLLKTIGYKIQENDLFKSPDEAM